MTQGAHNLKPNQRREAGRKGGKAQVPKGFAIMDDLKRREIARQGGLAKALKMKGEGNVTAA